ncbi:AEC family transporter [Flavobacterium sp. TSSA_36]|uniref:AEC family transporter n=1 Tax=Flavobacterium sp. TSSA_36 TaxID=3447669 RepID=UPI003F33B3CB
MNIKNYFNCIFETLFLLHLSIVTHMINFVIIIVFLALGIFLQRIPSIPKTTPKKLNWIVLQICLPALALYYIPKVQWSKELLFPILVAWIIFIASWILFALLGKQFGWSKKLTGCLIICSGLSNTSFIGFPIITALYGDSGMKTAILVDQPGSFVVLSTLGVLVATLYSKAETNGVQIIRKILLFPPFLTFVVACLMNVFDFDVLPFLQQGLKFIGGFVTPLALLSVGLQLKFERNSKHWLFLRLGLLYKLLLAPAIIYVLYVLILKQKSEVIEVALLESAMSPMITASILASSHGLKPKLCSMMIGFGIPISFFTLLFWYLIIH